MKNTICALALSAMALTGCVDKKIGEADVAYAVTDTVPMRVTNQRWQQYEDDGLDLCEVYADVNKNGRYDSETDVFMGLYQCWSLE